MIAEAPEPPPSGIGDTVALNNGVRMPWLGLGTYLVGGAAVRRAVTAALETGYRHFDTAAFYDNERELGEAIRASGVPRAEVFVTTKLWNSDHGAAAARRAFEQSAQRLGLGQIDLYLIHWPVPGKRLDSWRTLEELLGEGRCRAIGVSNYTIDHLRELLDECDVVPAVNQVEFSPFLMQRDLLNLCRERGIRLQSYSPLTKGWRLDHPRLREIGDRYGKTPAQILVRWSLEHRVVVLPKSATPAHIAENADVFDFEITPADLALLDGLHEGLRTSWDPTGEP